MISGNAILGQHPYFAFKQALEEIQAKKEPVTARLTKLFNEYLEKLDQNEKEADEKEAEIESREDLNFKDKFQLINSVFKKALDKRKGLKEKWKQKKAPIEAERDELDKEREELHERYLEDKKTYNELRYPQKPKKVRDYTAKKEIKIPEGLVLPEDEIPW